MGQRVLWLERRGGECGFSIALEEEDDDEMGGRENKWRGDLMMGKEGRKRKRKGGEGGVG